MRASRRSSRALYIETFIRADLDRVWQLTQDPRLHPRWDLRFSSIEPVAGADGRTRFRYSRRLPFHTIDGTGISLGERHRPDGSATSALAFGTSDRLSPLRDGRGYWRYVPEPTGIRFITGFDYTPGFGRTADVVLRPLVRWMTAWSFDRLRIWAETGEAPEHWPVWSVLALWRRARPRAARCRTVPPTAGAMSAAPASLDGLSTR